MGGAVSPINNFHHFYVFVKYHIPARHHLWRENCGDQDGGTVGKGVTDNDHRLVGTKRGKSVYETPKYLRTELARNQ